MGQKLLSATASFPGHLHVAIGNATHLGYFVTSAIPLLTVDGSYVTPSNISPERAIMDNVVYESQPKSVSNNTVFNLSIDFAATSPYTVYIQVVEG